MEDFDAADDSAIDYGIDAKIDKHSLEDCLEQQGRLRYKWTKVWAEARKEKARAKSELANVRSELAAKARSKWDLLGFPKMPTDQMVNDWIPNQPEYKEKELYLIEAERKVDVLSGVQGSFDDRRSALSDLVKLWLRGYYADDDIVGKEAKELLQEIRTDSHIEQLNKDGQFNKKIQLKRRR